MEVHAHTHTPRKKWTHYFWEFLMLFLAVFCGFLAEYQLEHKIEKERESQFIMSMVEDIEKDTSNIRISIESFNRQDKYFDTVFSLFSELNKDYNHSLHTSMMNLMGWKSFVATDKTLQQLKYAGGMRMIRKRKVADAIAGYDALLRVHEGDNQELQQAHSGVSNKLTEFYNMHALAISQRGDSNNTIEKAKKNYLLKNDAVSLGQYYNVLTIYRILRGVVVNSMDKLKIAAIELIRTLKDEYNMK